MYFKSKVANESKKSLNREEEKEALKAQHLAQQRNAILGHSGDLTQLCRKRNQSNLLKKILLTLSYLIIITATLIPMILLELWYLIAPLLITTLIYLLLLIKLHRRHHHEQTALENLRDFEEERRGSIPPPPARPPPVLTHYRFPSIDGKRGSLINWVKIEDSRLEFPQINSTSPKPQSLLPL